MSSKNLSEQIVHYRRVFIYLLIGTALTVGASMIEFNVEYSMAGALFVGLLIASYKGYLVAANFMHLNDEKKMIYWTLILTTLFLVILLFLPLLWDSNNMSNQTNHSLWDNDNSISHGDSH